MIKSLKRYFIRIKYGLPKTLKNVWWHQTIWSNKQRFPIVRWENIGYIHCKKGVIVAMEEIEEGLYAYYRVTDIRGSLGGDYIYDGDRYVCDMVFDRVSRKLGVGGLSEEDLKSPKLILNNP